MNKTNGITRKTCVLNFTFEIITGVIFILFLIINKKPVGMLEGLPIGMGGGAFIYNFLRKWDLDERDYSLYHKTNHLTLAAVVVGIIVVKLLNDVPGVTEFIDASWAQMIISVFFLFHGIFGLILFNRE